MKPTPEYKFTWDKDKALANERKHGITFVMATGVFHDPLIAITHDVADADDEERWIAVGATENGGLILVVHTVDLTHGDMHVRVISARKQPILKGEHMKAVSIQSGRLL